MRDPESSNLLDHVCIEIYYPLVNVYKKLLKMAIEIVEFPIKNWDFP